VFIHFNRLDSLQIQLLLALPVFHGEEGLELFFSIHWPLLMNQIAVLRRSRKLKKEGYASMT
jgi:hypothetical protein